MLDIREVILWSEIKTDIKDIKRNGISIFSLIKEEYILALLGETPKNELNYMYLIETDKIYISTEKLLNVEKDNLKSYFEVDTFPLGKVEIKEGKSLILTKEEIKLVKEYDKYIFERINTDVSIREYILKHLTDIYKVKVYEDYFIEKKVKELYIRDFTNNLCAVKAANNLDIKVIEFTNTFRKKNYTSYTRDFIVPEKLILKKKEYEIIDTKEICEPIIKKKNDKDLYFKGELDLLYNKYSIYENTYIYKGTIKDNKSNIKYIVVKVLNVDDNVKLHFNKEEVKRDIFPIAFTRFYTDLPQHLYVFKDEGGDLEIKYKNKKINYNTEYLKYVEPSSIIGKKVYSLNNNNIYSYEVGGEYTFKINTVVLNYDIRIIENPEELKGEILFIVYHEKLIERLYVYNKNFKNQLLLNLKKSVDENKYITNLKFVKAIRNFVKTKLKLDLENNYGVKLITKEEVEKIMNLS